MKILRRMAIALSALFVFGLMSCGSTKVQKKVEKEMYQPADPEDSRELTERELTKDEVEIYNYVISVLLQQHPTRTKTVIENRSYNFVEIPTDKIICMGTTVSVTDSKMSYEDYSIQKKNYFLKAKEGKYEEAFDAFIENNKIRLNIEKYLKGDDRVLLSKDVHSSMGEIEKGSFTYWDKLFEAAPASCGYLNLSVIGFDKAKTNAVVEVKFKSGAMSGYVNYLIFGKNEKGDWEVIDVEQIVFY